MWSFSIMLYHPFSHPMLYAPILTHLWTNSFPMTTLFLCLCWFIHSHDPLHFQTNQPIVVSLLFILLKWSKLWSRCQEIGLVALMFFFELLFSYVSLSISVYVSFANLFSIILFPYLLITRDTQDEGEARFGSTDTGNSLKVILRLKDLSRSSNRLVVPLVDLYQSLHSNSA